MQSLRLTLLQLAGPARGAASSGTLLQMAGSGDDPLDVTSVTFGADESSRAHLEIPWRAVAGEAATLEDLCAHPAEVTAVRDASDGWNQLSLDLVCDERQARVSLLMTPSGFEGSGAPRLRRALEAIEQLRRHALPRGASRMESALYGLGGVLPETVAKLQPALGPFYRREGPTGASYSSLDLSGWREARATLRRFDEAGRRGPQMVICENRPAADYAPEHHPDPSPWLLKAVGLPEQLDELEAGLRKADVPFKRLERGPGTHTPPSSAPPRPPHLRRPGRPG